MVDRILDIHKDMHKVTLQDILHQIRLDAQKAQNMRWFGFRYSNSEPRKK